MINAIIFTLWATPLVAVGLTITGLLFGMMYRKMNTMKQASRGRYDGVEGPNAPLNVLTPWQQLKRDCGVLSPFDVQKERMFPKEGER